MPAKTGRLFGYSFSFGALEEVCAHILDSKGVSGNTVNIVNTHMLSESGSNIALDACLRDAFMNVLDGMPLVYLLRWGGAADAQRAAGFDLFYNLLAELEQRGGGRVLLVGGTDEQLSNATRKVKPLFGAIEFYLDNPGMVSIDSYNPSTFLTENSDIDIVFVFLGCPKQEIVISRMAKVTSAVCIGLGGVLELVAGEKRRAPRWMRNLALEWLFRLVQDPRRLWRRYAVHNTSFIIETFKRLINGSLYK